MSVFTQGINKQLRVIIRNKTEEIFKSYKKTYIKRLNEIGEAWQKEVQELLGVPTDRKRNLTPFPKRRTGGLQRSIQSPHVRKDTMVMRSRGFYYESTISFTKMYSRYTGNNRPFPEKDMKPRGMDVGDYLDNQGDKPFYGWKARTSQLFNMMIQKASYLRNGGGRTWETRDFFTRDMVKKIEDRNFRIN